MLALQHFDGRVLVRHAVAADPRGERPVLLLVELHLVVLNDHHAAAFDVVEQPAVVRLQIVAALVGAHPRHDHVVLRKIAPREIVTLEERHPGAELLDRGRHLIADADDVADGEIGNRLDVDDLQRRLARFDHLPPLNVRILDVLVANRELLRAGRRRRDGCAKCVLADLRLGGRGDEEPRRQRFVFVRETE